MGEVPLQAVLVICRISALELDWSDEMLAIILHNTSFKTPLPAIESLVSVALVRAIKVLTLRQTNEFWSHWMLSNHSYHVLCPYGQHRWVIELVEDKAEGTPRNKDGKILTVLIRSRPDTRDEPNKECWHASAKGSGMRQDSFSVSRIWTIQ